MKTTLLQVFVLIIISLPIMQGSAQPTFVNRTGSGGGDFGLTCAPTFDSGIILGAETYTPSIGLHSGLVKYDSYGTMEWYKLYQIGDRTIPYSVLQAEDEGYIVQALAGDSSYAGNNIYFLTLYKTDNFGNTQWNKQYSLSDNDVPLNLVRRKAGGYISFSLGDYNIGVYPKTIVTRFDVNGDIVWSKKFTVPYGLRGVKGIEMPDNNICFIANAGDPSNNFFLDAVVTMLDPSGNILWSKSIGSHYDDEPFALAANSSNDIFITGRNYFLNRAWDSFLFRLDKNGNMISSKVYDGGTYDGEIMRCILAFDDGSCKLLGDMGTFDERDIVMLNIDSNLSVSSAKRYMFSPMFTNYPYDFFKADDGGLVFTGDYRPPTVYRDAIIAKTESDGSLPCFMSIPLINEHNEFFYDTMITVLSQPATITPLLFAANVPANPFNTNVVCALAAENNEVDRTDERIFPNPVSDFLLIDMSITDDDTEVQLIDIGGRIVYTAIIKARSEMSQIDMRNLPSGTYSLRYLSGSKTGMKVIVKL